MINPGTVETASLQLDTLFTFDAQKRILSTREPQATPGPLFILIRSRTECVWAARSDLPEEIAQELNQLASEEPPCVSFREVPIHAGRYQALLNGQAEWGLTFKFPQAIQEPQHVVRVEEERLLGRHFRGWVPGELGAGRAPLMAVLDDEGYPVSVCFCARRSPAAAEAGVDTAARFRGQGLAPRVTAAWALAVRALGLAPLYSTSWSNQASQAVARKLALEIFAVDWSISG